MTERLGKIGILFFFAVAGIGGSGCHHVNPPPCTAGASCIAWPPAGWPDALKQIQIDEEWTVWSAGLAFSVLPADLKAQWQARYDEARSTVDRADAVFVDAANAVAAGTNQDYAAMVNDITAGLGKLISLVEQIIAAAIEGTHPPDHKLSAPRPEASKHLADARTRLEHLKTLPTK